MAPEIKTKLYKGKKRQFVINGETGHHLFLNNRKVFELYPDLQVSVNGVSVAHDSLVYNKRTKRRMLARNYASSEQGYEENIIATRPPDWTPDFQIKSL